MRLTALLAAFAVTSFPALAQASREKCDLRVLLVGQDPEAPVIRFVGLTTERTHELYRERTPAFERLLREHFASVRVVYRAEYEPAMSDTVDVTLFDAIPKRPLPHDFDRPALMVGVSSPRIGEPLGLKLDWL